MVRPRSGQDSKPLLFATTRSGYEEAASFILQAASEACRTVAPTEVLVGIEFAGSYGFTFAYFLHALGFQVVSVLPSDTKRWKEVMHHQPLKTDSKDAQGITDLTATGHYVRFAFLAPEYAELRYLVSTRERFSLLYRAAITRLKSTLELVFPEFEQVFPSIHRPTALAVLEAFPSPAALLSAPRDRVRFIIERASLRHRGDATVRALRAAARQTLGLPLAHGALANEVPLIIAQMRMLRVHLAVLEGDMARVLASLPEGPWLLTIPGVSTVTAATFVGSIGDVRSYDSSRQVLRVAGMSLVETSSGQHQGKPRLSKRGRPALRRHAFMLAMRWVRTNGLFRAEFEAMTARNGVIKLKALIAISRRALRILFTIAKEQRAFVEHAVPA